MDNLEKLIKEQRTNLDTARLSDEKWAEISGKFHKKQLIPFWKITSVAASFLILVTAGYFIFTKNLEKSIQSDQLLFTEHQEGGLPDESIFVALIKNAEYQVKDQKVPANYKSMFNDFIKQLDVLDQQYELYKKQIMEHGYSEEIVQQVIYHYQLKLSVLEMLQKEIEKINELSKVKNNEKVNLSLKL